MSFAKVHSAQAVMLDAFIVAIEVDISRGLYAFSIVGLPDKAVEEARDRVSAAIKNSGFDSPKSNNHKLVISLAPAELRKEGPNFDLGIALAYLLAHDDIRFESSGKIFLGELSLDGKLRPIRGVLPLVLKAREQGFTEIFVPEANAPEAALVSDITVYSAATLGDIINHLNTKGEIPPTRLEEQARTEIVYEAPRYTIDMYDVRGQESAKRGLEIAAAGGHNIGLFGPPGTGKTMLAKALTGILPPLPFDDILEVTGIHSIAGTLDQKLITHPPFRSPHHTSSYVSLVGGGTIPKPGEITLAHKGVLFLDEFPEFERRVVEALRQPLEDRIVSVSRAKGSTQFPADVILIAAMNPCPCGNFSNDTSGSRSGPASKPCSCSPTQIAHYSKKLSGPIVDRIDMWVEVGNIDHEKLSAKQAEGAEYSETIRERIQHARTLQHTRFGKSLTNSAMGVKDIEKHIPIDKETKELLNTSAKKLGLSARAYHRILKLARTIADLAGESRVTQAHILEALQYRPKNITPEM